MEKITGETFHVQHRRNTEGNFIDFLFFTYVIQHLEIIALIRQTTLTKIPRYNPTLKPSS